MSPEHSPCLRIFFFKGWTPGKILTLPKDLAFSLRFFPLFTGGIMKRIDGIKDLEKFGIEVLTGESDQHMHRILCDCTAKGKRIIERTLGIEVTLAPNWNSGRPEDPSIGSLLVPLEFVSSFGIFALLSDPQTAEVWLLKNDSVVGFSTDDVDLKEALRTHYEGQLRKVFFPRPCDRNVHLFTGRTT